MLFWIVGGALIVAAAAAAVASLTKRSEEEGPDQVFQLEGLPYRAVAQYGRHRLGADRVACTEFEGQVPWDGGALRLASVAWKGNFDQYYGGRDVRLGHPEIDHRYFIQGNPEALVRRFLDEPTLDRLWHLHEGTNGAILLQIRPRHAFVRVSRTIERGPKLVAFAKSCNALVQRLLDVGEPGVRLQSAAPTADAPECQVCGSKLEDSNRVHCRRCRTPHHRDCWEYNEGCSTFACGERRTVER